MLVSVGAPVGGSIQFASPIPVKLEFGEGQTLAYQDSGRELAIAPAAGQQLCGTVIKVSAVSSIQHGKCILLSRLCKLKRNRV